MECNAEPLPSISTSCFPFYSKYDLIKSVNISQEIYPDASHFNIHKPLLIKYLQCDDDDDVDEEDDDDGVDEEEEVPKVQMRKRHGLPWSQHWFRSFSHIKAYCEGHMLAALPKQSQSTTEACKEWYSKHK